MAKPATASCLNTNIRSAEGRSGLVDTAVPSVSDLTVIHNGVLALLNEEIHGETGHRILPEYKHKISRGPLGFGGHGCPIRFRSDSDPQRGARAAQRRNPWRNRPPHPA